MKIVSLTTNVQYTKELVSKLEMLGEFKDYNVKKLKGDEIVNHIGDADVLITGNSGVSQITPEVLTKCSNLKYISFMSSGTDYVDLETASKLGIKISNIRGANSQSVAEHVWGLILALSKKITESHNGAKNGKFEFSHYEGVELYGKTIGIVGLGEIGSSVAKIAMSLDMQILAYNRSNKEINGIKQVELESLLKESDVIAVCVMVNNETINLIDEKEFKLMKKGVILVSVSRESIINKNALIAALDEGKLFGVGLELEINTPANEKFYKYPNVILTPHNGFFTTESEIKVNNQAVENVVSFAQGDLVNIVN